MEDYFRMKEMKDMWQQNVMWFWTGLFCYTGHYWDNWKNLNGFWGLGTRNALVLTFWLMVVLCLCRKKKSVVGNTHQGVNGALGVTTKY